MTSEFINKDLDSYSTLAQGVVPFLGPTIKSEFDLKQEIVFKYNKNMKNV